MIVGLRERIKQASAGGKPKGNIRDLLFMEDLQWRIINAFAPNITDNKVIPVYGEVVTLSTLQATEHTHL